MRPRFFALAALLSGTAAAQAQSTADMYVWGSYRDQNKVNLFYGWPEPSDDFLILINCDRKTGRAELILGIEPDAPDGTRVPIALSGPGGKVRFMARSQIDEGTGEPALAAVVAPGREFVRPVGRTGSLVLTVGKRRYVAPLSPRAATALGSFRRNCPSAR